MRLGPGQREWESFYLRDSRGVRARGARVRRARSAWSRRAGRRDARPAPAPASTPRRRSTKARSTLSACFAACSTIGVGRRWFRAGL